MSVDVLIDSKAQLGEGPRWDAANERLLWVDVKRGELHAWDGEQDHVEQLEAPLSAVAPGDRDRGFPDGLTVDDEGAVWLAVWGGRCVLRYTPDGELDRVLEVPAEHVTACCFGPGTSLFITTAAPDGRVFVADVGVGGPPAQPFLSTAPSDAEPTSAR